MCLCVLGLVCEHGSVRYVWCNYLWLDSWHQIKCGGYGIAAGNHCCLLQLAVLPLCRAIELHEYVSVFSHGHQPDRVLMTASTLINALQCNCTCTHTHTPQKYSPVFLGMENSAYCNWITNPAHWGGGIELSILAAHYRREIAAWNLATGALHVFGEEEGAVHLLCSCYEGCY
jgi:hypothetical protein